VGSHTVFSKLELFRLKRIIEIVALAKTCSSSAQYMSHDLQHLYASKKKFWTLSHQYDKQVFDLSDKSQMLPKSKKVSISYHGALMLGRNADNLLQAYQELLKEDPIYKENSELILRVKGVGIKELKQNFRLVENIKILDFLNFSNSSNEQIYHSDIVIILENGPLYCNILVGKAPFLAAYGKPILSISPEKSELREIIIDDRCIANMNDISDIKEKLKILIDNRLTSKEDFKPFGDYFSEENFKQKLDQILNN
jgi:glycosyltransferase involved in cell wall biosynthesis